MISYITSKMLNINSVCRCYSAKAFPVIPKRIDRDPTDVLKALAFTVKKDPTALQYKIPDDPHFMHPGFRVQRNMVLSIESGRKAAQFVINQNINLFQHRIAEPLTEVYTPKLDFEKIADFNEQILIQFIGSEEVECAINTYEKLLEKDVEVSDETKQKLLELVCFYNCENKYDPMDLVTKWFESKVSKVNYKTWNDNGFAEKLFRSIKQDCPRAISAIIMGRLKYNQIVEAFQLFESARSRNIPLSVGVYNGLLQNVHVVMENDAKRWGYIEKLLVDMDSSATSPDIYTLNAVLHTLVQFKDVSKRDLIMRTLAEFNRIGINPGLGTYVYLIRTFVTSHDREKAIFIMNTILNDLCSRPLTVEHPMDLEFFKMAMNNVSKYLWHSGLAKRVNELLRTTGKHKLFSGNLSSSEYYLNYIFVVLEKEPIEDAIALYKELVPAYTNPNSQMFEVYLVKVMESGASEYFAFLWREIKNAGLSFVSTILDLFLLAILDYKPRKAPEEEEIMGVFKDVVDFGLESLTKTMGAEDFVSLHTSLTKFNQDFAEKLLLAFVKFENVDKAVKVFKVVSESGNVFLIGAGTLELLVKLCVDNGRSSSAFDILNYGFSRKYDEVPKMAKKFLPQLQNLSEGQKDWLADMTKSARLEDEKNNKSEPS